MSILITNIQRMCFDDGPGIRTTVFLKGCSVCCPWCCNPENIRSGKEHYFRKSRCSAENGSCVFNSSCAARNGRNPFADARITEIRRCPAGALGVYGTEYRPDELCAELLKDRIFWGTDGGVTFSGGESLLQAEALEPVLTALKALGIHLALETALFVPKQAVETALKYIDHFYIDVKLLNRDACREVLGGELSRFLSNAALVADSGKSVVFRVPCNAEYTMTAENQALLLKFFAGYKNLPVELFATHNLGKSKYESLNQTAPEFSPYSPDAFLKVLRENGNDARMIEL